MAEKLAYLFVMDGYSDWEIGYLAAELNTGRFFREPGTRVPVRTVAVSREPITSMGGIRIQPDVALAEISPPDAALLVLPGGDNWGEERHAPALDMARRFLDAGVPVGAICGGADAMAGAGMLDERPHTANDLDMLKAVYPGYGGAAHYVDAAAVTDGDLITAGGVNPLEFTQHVLVRLGVLAPNALDAWYQLQKTGNSKYFHALMAALPQPVG